VLGAFLPFDPQLSDGKPSDVPKGFGRNESMHAQVPAIPDTFHHQSSTSLKNQSKERHLGRMGGSRQMNRPLSRASSATAVSVKMHWPVEASGPFQDPVY
jgi:hypothetical protein